MSQAGDPLTFGDPFSFRVCAGGYVYPAQPIYRFPITAVDLKTGVDHPLLLNVPYKGKVPEPTTNYSRSGSKGKDRWRTFGPHMLAITGLEVEGMRLRVVLGMEKWSGVLAFDIVTLLKGEGK